MALRAIWAQALDRRGRAVIGFEGSIPWNLPADLQHFRRLTTGGVVVMGRKTWESLPDRVRPLPGRMNIVVSSSASTSGVTHVKSLQSARRVAMEQASACDVWIIGGARLFADAIAVADGIEVTEVDLLVDGDTFAPAIPVRSFAATRISRWQRDLAGIRYRHISYDRIGH